MAFLFFRPLARRGIGEPIPARSDALAVTGRVNMAEPKTVTATEDKPQVTPPVVEPPKEPDVSPGTVVLDDDKEPGGDSPEAVFARKVWRERREARAEAKAARDEAQRERDERIRAEEQLRLAKEAPTTKETKIYSMAEVRQAVRDGRISEADGDTYIQDTIIPHQIKQTLEAEKRQQAEKQPLERAAAELEEFKTIIPQIMVEGSDERTKVLIEVRRLMDSRGWANDSRTQVQAVENVFGRLSENKKRGEVDRATRAGLRPGPVDAGAGGAGVTTGAVDLSKAPPGMRAMWERNGDSVETRKKELKIYQDLKASGRRF